MKIPSPTLETSAFTAAQIAEWHADQAKLAADKRTAGNAPRPAWLVAHVLGKAGR